MLRYHDIASKPYPGYFFHPHGKTRMCPIHYRTENAC